MLNFNQADERVVAALRRMASPEMRPLLEFINKQLEDTKVALVLSEDAMYPRLQGRARYLQDFTDAVKNASKTS